MLVITGIMTSKYFRLTYKHAFNHYVFEVIVCEHDGHCITVIDSKRSGRLVPVVVGGVSCHVHKT